MTGPEAFYVAKSYSYYYYDQVITGKVRKSQLKSYNFNLRQISFLMSWVASVRLA